MLMYQDYGPSLYKSLGYGSVDQLLFSSGWVSVAFAGNAVNALLVDRVGRVRMLCAYKPLSGIHGLTGLTETSDRFLGLRARISRGVHYSFHIYQNGCKRRRFGGCVFSFLTRRYLHTLL